MGQTGGVFLVGAGCGADLITVRGLRLLQCCDAVVYDALADPALLDEAPRAQRYPVGKRGGAPSLPQEEINALLIRLAKAGKAVVRLKGGDPFVFGRSGEEALALAAADVPCTVVPGVSSCIAAPELAGIPVTHRGVSAGFHVVTGRTADGLPSEPMETLAALRGTLVVLMGLGALERLAQGLMAAGKPAETPAAVVCGAGTARPICARGALSEIAARAREAGAYAPAVLVVGDAAGLALSV